MKRLSIVSIVSIVNRSKTLFLIAVIGLLISCDSPNPQKTDIQESTGIAEMVFKNGNIYTVEDSEPWAEAVALLNGEFVYVGKNEGVDSWVGDSTTVVDLNGKFVMPGIYDMHLHPDLALVPEKVGQKTVPHLATPEEIKKLILEVARSTDRDAWIVLHDWQIGPFLEAGIKPGMEWIDSFMPDRPVFLVDNSRVYNMFNAKAAELAGIDQNTRDPRHGYLERDPETGKLTGIVIDGAQAPFWEVMPPIPQTAYEEAYLEAVQRLAAVGVVGAKFSHMNIPMIEAVHFLDENDQLTLRVETHLSWKDDLAKVDDRWDYIAGKRLMYRSDLVNPNGVKFHFDGVVPARSGLMLEPYRDEESWRGSTNLTNPEIKDVVVYCDKLGIRVDAHCQGDGAARLFLDAVEHARNINGPNGPRHQMTHSTFIHPEDRSRFAQLNVIPEFSPIYWFNSPAVNGMKTLLSDSQVEGAFPISEVLAENGRGVIGTDWPVTPLEGIWVGFETLVTRENPWGEVEGILGTPISLEQAIRMLTINGAWAMEVEDITGSIKVGKSADFIVLNQNLFEINPKEISKTIVLTTVFRGNPVNIEESTRKYIEAQIDKPFPTSLRYP
ncbi:amidohydrolase [Lentimicrobium sp. S6]|uniref:amidohydrolase n=1 Tax=Lentimicrobium sp. S6 TaxID=2735872 RepID=UPI0015583177|nr:amidohydrolase [Lentimicrobium sp. S6]NPD48132.1 amidohydrolase [Lentimicrobium sp. S6]